MDRNGPEVSMGWGQNTTFPSKIPIPMVPFLGFYKSKTWAYLWAFEFEKKLELLVTLATLRKESFCFNNLPIYSSIGNWVNGSHLSDSFKTSYGLFSSRKENSILKNKSFFLLLKEQRPRVQLGKVKTVRWLLPFEQPFQLKSTLGSVGHSLRRIWA